MAVLKEKRGSEEFSRMYSSPVEWFTACKYGPHIDVTVHTHDYFDEYFTVRIGGYQAQVTREQLEEMWGKLDIQIRAALDVE